MNVQRTVLPNGITVLSEHMDSVRSIALGVWFAVGSRDESREEAGLSHFMEHMMFKGTARRSAQEISETFDTMGAEYNAFTWKEFTAYYARFVDEQLDEAFDLLSDMVSKSQLKADAINVERNVVIEEIARRDDAPDDLVHEIFDDVLWPRHPLGRSTLGTRETVGGFKRADFVAFRKRHYLTGNTVVAAAGNVDHDELVALAKKKLSLPTGPRSRRRRAPELKKLALGIVPRETEQSHIVLGTETFGANHPDRFALGMLNGVLGGGMASRLFTEIREKRGLAYAVGSSVQLFQGSGQFGVYAWPTRWVRRYSCSRVRGSSAFTPVLSPRTPRRSLRSCAARSRRSSHAA
jgi:predicted Zn-dependent peptidase